MRHRGTLCALALGLMASACATQPIRWTRDGASQQDFSADRYQCVQESRVQWNVQGGLLWIAAAQIDAQRQADQLFVLCMQAHGWTGTRASVQQAQAPTPRSTCVGTDCIVPVGAAPAGQVVEADPAPEPQWCRDRKGVWTGSRCNAVPPAGMWPLSGCPGETVWNGVGCTAAK
jgi:hypothetical protein